jgi:predicted permease
MESLLMDIRYGLRALVAKPSFTIIAVLALALGIGANTAIFSVVNGVLLKPLPYKQPDKLVRIWEKWGGFNRGSVSYLNFVDWRERNKSFEKMAAYRWAGYNLSGGQQPERIFGQTVSAEFLSVLGVSTAVGRDFTPEEDQLGANLTAIISDTLWKNRYHGDPAIVGKTIVLDDDQYTIVGVLPAEFRFFGPRTDILSPIKAKKLQALEHRDWHPGIQAIARLKEGVTLTQANADMTSIAEALGQQYPDSNKEHWITLGLHYDATVEDVKLQLWLLLGAVGFVLLIACANVANLMLARATARQKEIAIRSALGADRLRIVRLLITESIILSLCGGGLGVLIAYWGTGLALKALPNVLPRTNEIGMDGKVLLFALGVSLLTGIVFGMVPAIQASKPDLNETLKDGGRSGTGARQAIRSILVISEIAIALVLLIGAGLMIRSFMALNQVDAGFDTKNVLTMDISLSPNAYEGPKTRNFYKQFLEKVRNTAGVQSAAVTDLLPLNGGDSESTFYVGGRPKPPQSELPLAMTYTVSPGYIETMRIPLLKGRTFEDRDTQQSGLTTVIDENMVKDYFPNEDPLGQHLVVGDASVHFEMQIIGVVGHVKQENLDTPGGSDVKTQFYTCLNQIPDQFLFGGMTMVVRTNTDPMSFFSTIRGELVTLDANQTIHDPVTLDKRRSDAISNRRFILTLLGGFSVVALIMASLGIYGVISYSVSQRTREIGIRMALGAGRANVMAMVLGNGAKLALIGIVVGAVGGLFLMKVMSSFLFGVSATDPVTYLAISAILAFVALLASYIPARRAMKVDPITALRYE